MEITTLCTLVASLRVVPNRSQFFLYESVTLSCGKSGNSSDWRVKRNTSMHIDTECSVNWGNRNESHCFIGALYTLDTGVYWCEFGPGECSDPVNITVTGGSVILESPVLPVQEGQPVTLRCISQTPSSSDLFHFYKDGVLVGNSSTGNATIRSVSKSDEGLYKCDISGAAESRGSWLAVRVGRHESSFFTLACVLLPVVGIGLLLASAMLLCLWRNRKGQPCCAAGEVDPDVSYTDVTIAQEVQQRKDGGMDNSSTFYSTLQLDAM
ncbi:low affinity immunoglobulin gamma Fc region receptor II-b-like [Clinocottus analis]|uniref:low affinity immunoglobulin gamma Fc region receptor II-b-like n=1 Tax=Clinocottus analis TaxID=304258 RepID=UPI0035C097AE